MKKLLFIILLLPIFLYGQQTNSTNTKFTNGLQVPNGATPKPTSGLTAGALSYVTGVGLQYYDGSAWVTLGVSSGGVTSFNSRTGAVIPLVGDYSSFYILNQTSQQSSSNFNISGTGTMNDLITKSPYVDVRAYASISAAITAIGSTASTLLIPNSQSVSASVTIPANVSVQITQGGLITIASGQTLTFNGGINAGLYQIFAGSGTVVFGNGITPRVYPEWWYTGSGSWHTAINQALTATSSKGISVYLSGKEYATSGSIVLQTDNVLEGYGARYTGTVINYSGSAEAIKVIDDFNYKTVKNLGIKGGVSDASTGILVGAPLTTIEHVNFPGFLGRSAIKLTDSASTSGPWLSHLRDIIITPPSGVGALYGLRYGIWLDTNSNSVTVSNASINYPGLDAIGGAGVYVTGGSGITLEDINIENGFDSGGTVKGFWLAGGVDILLKRPYMENNRTNLLVSGANYVNIESPYINGFGQSLYGIKIDSTSNRVSIKGGYIASIVGSGTDIYLSGSPTNVQILNVSTEDTGYTGTPLVNFQDSTKLNLNGNVNIGGAPQSNASFTPLLSVVTADANKRLSAINYFGNDANEPVLALGKSRGTTVGSWAYPTANTGLGQIIFEGASVANSRFDAAASIRGFATTDWSGTNYNAGLQFATTASGATSRAITATLSGAGLWNWTNYGSGVVVSDGSGNITSTSTPTFTGTNITGTASGLNIGGNAATATALATGRTIGTLTGDITSAGSSFDGTSNNTNATTLATVNSNVGSFTNATITVNNKGLITAASNGTAPVTTLAAIGSSPNANGASLSGSTLNLQPASASFGGVITTAAQTFAGDKTFNGFIYGDGGLISNSRNVGAGGYAAQFVNTNSGGRGLQAKGGGSASAGIAALEVKDYRDTTIANFYNDNIDFTKPFRQFSPNGNYNYTSYVDNSGYWYLGNNVVGNAITIGDFELAYGVTVNTSLTATSGIITSNGNILGGLGNMTITSGTGASRTLAFKTTTAGGTATTALTLGADQSGAFAGALSAVGDVSIGGAVQNNAGTTTAGLSLSTATAGDRSVFLNYFGSDANAPQLFIGKSRGASVGTITYPSLNDFLGRIFFTGASEANSRFDISASIDARVGSTWTASNYETKLDFATTASGAVSRAVNMSLSGAGILTITNLGTGAVQSTAGVLSVTSDSRVKSLHGTYKGSALTAISKLDLPQYWNYSAKSGLPKEAQDVRQFSVLADKVYNVLGEQFAPTQKDGYHSLADRALLSLTIQALQELKKEVDELKKNK